MRFSVITALPESLDGYLQAGVLGRAIDGGLVQTRVLDLRTWGVGRHRSIDDAPFGGGQGMVLQPGPLVSAIEAAREDAGPRCRVVLLGPGGARFDRAAAHRFAHLDDLVLVCGRYEGVDERVAAFVDEELSLGDFVLTGGELAALAVIDATARLLPGVLGNAASAVHESFEDALLEHPHYTRPREFRGMPVPEVLLSGDHARIEAWRRAQSEARTAARRPDLRPTGSTSGVDDDSDCV